jgi:hypothetical protein
MIPASRAIQRRRYSYRNNEKGVALWFVSSGSGKDAVARRMWTYLFLGTTLRTTSERLQHRIHRLSSPRQVSVACPKSSVPPRREPGATIHNPLRHCRSSRCAGPHRAGAVARAQSRRDSSAQGNAYDQSRPWLGGRCPSSRPLGRHMCDVRYCARVENTGPGCCLSVWTQ